MKTVTLENTYHNTMIRARVGRISRATANRIRRTLCGCQGCTCGGPLGERGAQQQPDGSRLAITDEPDGEAWIGIVTREECCQ